MDLQHIQISTNAEGLVTVAVEDTELFDYVEDHLIENHGIEYKYLKVSEGLAPKVYTITFGKEYAEDNVVKALSELNPSEIERIYAINKECG